MAPLLPKLRGHFAEFLNNGSPVRLRIFSSSTCVGLGYGYLQSYLAAFLASVNSLTSLLYFTPRHHLALMVSVLDCSPASWFGHAFPFAWINYPTVSLHHLNDCRQYRNVNLLFITYGFRPGLRSRLTLGGQTFPRKPWTFDRKVSRFALATYAGILSCMLSTAPFDTASACIHCSSTNIKKYS